jgi:molybdopterin-guanine dinucleotide biosynthesis protein A
MHTDKAFLELDGRPLVSWVGDALLGAGASELVAVGGDARRLGALGFTVLADREPGGGPFAAMAVGLRQVAEDLAVVVACDLPRLSPSLVNSLVARLDDADVDVVVPVVDGRAQNHCLAVRRDAVAGFEAELEAGVRSLHGGIEGGRVCHVDVVDDGSLCDVDTIDDLVAFRDGRRPSR